MRSFVQALIRRKIALAGSLVLLLILALAIFAPIVAPHDPMGLNSTMRLQGPTTQHWFGTDHFGRDIFSRVVYGARLTMVSGLGVVLYSVCLGVLIGMLSGYFRRPRVRRHAPGGRGDVLSRPAPGARPPGDPGAGPPQRHHRRGGHFLTRTSRIIFGLTLKLKEEAFVEATRSLGPNNLRILSRHILPNLLSPVIVAGHVHVRLFAAAHGRAGFPGGGRPAADPELGEHDQRGARLHHPGARRPALPRGSSLSSRCCPSIWSGTCCGTTWTPGSAISSPG